MDLNIKITGKGEIMVKDLMDLPDDVPFKASLRIEKAKGRHVTDSPFCWCNPEVRTMENGNRVVIHNEDG